MAAPTREAPLVVGRYVIHDRIAAGGMAAVHLGRLMAPAGFARTVAIKRLHSQFALDPEFVLMFTDEARLAARIRHPNVVPTIDVVAAEGELFLVMEYVEGESLSYLVRAQLGTANDPRRPTIEWMSPQMVSSIMTGVLLGLHAAHEAVGEDRKPACIVHRDVSPQNILVGVDGVARLLDFGVSRAAGQLHTTREGVLRGKLGYMAPEQATRGVANRQTDIFSAAIVLWEVLTRQRLFHAENDAAIYTNVVGKPIEPPSRVIAHLPGAVDAVVMKGLDRDPTKRFATAAEMAGALEEAIAPATARRVGAWVSRIAAERLEERAELISKFETDGSARKPSDAVAKPEAADPVDEAQTSSLSVKQKTRGGLGRRRAVVAGGATLLAGGALAVAIHGGSRPEPATETALAPTVPAASASEVPLAAEGPTATTAATAEPPPAPSASVAAVVSSSTATPLRIRRPLPKPAASSKPASPVPAQPTQPVYTRE